MNQAMKQMLRKVCLNSIVTNNNSKIEKKGKVVKDDETLDDEPDNNTTVSSQLQPSTSTATVENDSSGDETDADLPASMSNV